MHAPPHPPQPELTATAPPVDTGKGPAGPTAPLKWLCLHPSVFKVHYQCKKWAWVSGVHL